MLDVIDVPKHHIVSRPQCFTVDPSKVETCQQLVPAGGSLFCDPHLVFDSSTRHLDPPGQLQFGVVSIKQPHLVEFT